MMFFGENPDFPEIKKLKKFDPAQKCENNFRAQLNSSKTVFAF